METRLAYVKGYIVEYRILHQTPLIKGHRCGEREDWEEDSGGELEWALIAMTPNVPTHITGKAACDSLPSWEDVYGVIWDDAHGGW